MTYQNLYFECITCVLHLLVIVMPSWRKLRDLMFTGLTIPIGTIVCFEFWSIWHFVSPMMIMPKQIQAFSPPWSHHLQHTLPLLTNYSLLLLDNHGWPKNVHLIWFIYGICYSTMFYYCRWVSGSFIYPYMNLLSIPMQVVVVLKHLMFLYLVSTISKKLNDYVHNAIVSEPVEDTKKVN